MDAATEQRARQDALDLINAGNFSELAKHLATGITGSDSFHIYHDLPVHRHAQPYGLFIKIVHAVGGGEGMGEHVERVIEASDGEVVLCYFRLTGFYSSHEGTEWNDEVEQVFPHQVTVTQYLDTPARQQNTEERNLAELIAHLRTCDWNLRSPREVADMIIDQLEALSN